MEHTQKIRIGRVALPKIDDQEPVPETQREIHATSNPSYSSGFRAANEDGRAIRAGALLANLDHRA